MARKKKQGGITLADVAKGVFMLATAAKLKTRREVETGLREALPGASVLSVESGTRSKGYKFKIFTIAYRDIQFTYESYQSGNFFFAGKSAMSNDDYCKQLFRHFSQEIGEIGEKYGVKIDELCGISICNEYGRTATMLPPWRTWTPGWTPWGSCTPFWRTTSPEKS